MSRVFIVNEPVCSKTGKPTRTKKKINNNSKEQQMKQFVGPDGYDYEQDNWQEPVVNYGKNGNSQPLIEGSNPLPNFTGASVPANNNKADNYDYEQDNWHDPVIDYSYGAGGE